MNDHLSTRCVHAGEAADRHGSPHTPIYTTTTFRFPSTAAILDVVEGRRPGALMGSKDLTMPVWNWRKNLGQAIAPESPRSLPAACAP